MCNEKKILNRGCKIYQRMALINGRIGVVVDILF